jgi:hypothetical protein
MSLSAKREALARIHGRYQRAGCPHRTHILDKCLVGANHGNEFDKTLAAANLQFTGLEWLPP